MRKLITISFLAIYLLGNTEVGQLVNLPKLIAHYQQHQQINSDVSFIDFVDMHYFGDDGITSDDNQDNELPFRQLHKPFSAIAYIVPPFASFNSNTTIITPEKLNFLKNEFPISGYSTLPIRPPEL
ncbi:MAG: hypothetical protein IPK31_17490 [Chitinophagaceae bacterium]|nr:hypothetical protein [Chitinophagaceae bacterium]